MFLLGLLIVFPLLIAVVVLLVKNDIGRTVIVSASCAFIAVLSIYASVAYLGTTGVVFRYSSEVVNICCMAMSVFLAILIIYMGVKYKNIWAVLLAAIQIAGSLVFEIAYAPKVEPVFSLYIDSLSIVMTLIIGIIGTGIIVYALGYMRDFQAHEPEDAKDRRPSFFAIMFLFLSGMYMIVFCNNMSWMFTGWEITTTCSFLLIAYTRTDEAIRNAFRQIIMNMLGGIAFLIALYMSAISIGTLEFNKFISYGVMHPAVVSIPVCLLAFAGLTKAAQMPFHTWLLGAMVAPTPTSALLHSSTMVKAGVFLLIKLAPLFAVCTMPAYMVILVGGITFMLCSFMAISQTNAKRVLAYSTIANLGLIVACAGVATAEAVWAAVLLMIFHACAKSLLFLCVGTAEHHIGSRNIEDMDLLFERMPQLARLMMLGIMCMFIAPFGMLIAKWATLVSFVDTNNVILILLLAFGSAATFMFWAKWLGKLAGIAGQPENVEVNVYPSEWFAMYLMAFLAIIACVALPLVSALFVEPYLLGVFGVYQQAISTDNLWVSSVLAVFVVIMLVASHRQSGAKKGEVYLSGVSVDSDSRAFRNSLSGESIATSRNMYLEPVFGEKNFRRLGEVLCTAIIVVALIASGIVL